MKRLSCIIAFVTTIVIILFSTPQSMAQIKITSPDFAYPAKVRQNADRIYSEALKKNDNIAALRALMDASLAQTAVSPDSAGAVAYRLEKFASDCSDKTVSSLAYLVTAKLYNDVYSSNMGVYNNRTLPLAPLPANLQEWSGEQFIYKINTLCDSAISKINSAPTESLSKYLSLININTDSKVFFPTVADFVFNSVIEIKCNGLPYNLRLPLSAMSLDSTPAYLKNLRPQLYEILSLYDSVIKRNRNSAAPYLFFVTEKLLFLKSRIYTDDRDKATTQYCDMLNKLRTEYSSSEYSTLPLLLFAETTDTNKTHLYGELQTAVKRFPNSLFTNALKNKLKQLSQKQLDMTHQTVVCPGKSLKVFVEATNISNAQISLYRLPNDFTSTDNYTSLVPGAVKIKTESLSFAGTVPFSSTDSIEFEISQPGRYIIVPSFSGASHSRQNYQVIHASALSLGSFIGNRTKTVVVEPITGTPIQDAEIIGFVRNNRKISTNTLGKTDRNGFCIIPLNFSGTVRPVKGDDKFATDTYIYQHSQTNDKASSYITLFSDLPIYLPGDKVQWALVSYSSSTKKMTVQAATVVRVVFYDVNHNPIDTVNVTTDDFGRASGNFTVPEGLLTGRYSITAFTETGDSRNSISILVSDYKLPSYLIDDIIIENDTPQKGYTTLSGLAKTYSGTPLAGISVKLDLSTAPLWWRAGASSDIFYNSESKTDIDGKFRFVITADDYNLAPDINSAFSANITALSSSGESANISKRFTLGAKYNLQSNLPSDINISNPITLSVNLENVNGENIEEPIELKILDNSKTIYSHIIIDAKPVDLSKINSGVYNFEFSAANAATVKIENIALYHSNDTIPPRKSIIWVPEKTVKNGDTLLIGTSNEVTNVLFTLSDNDKIINQEWMTLASGMHNIPVSVPDHVQNAQLWLFSMADYKTSVEKITVSPRTPKNRIRISTETWRDRLSSGSLETITFKVSSNDSSTVSAAMMLDMYNAALQTFGHQSLDFNPRRPFTPTLDFNSPRTENRAYSTLSSNVTYLNTTDVSVPELNTYGRSFGQPLRVRGGMVMYSARSASKAELNDETVLVSEHKMAYNSVADLAEEVTVDDTDAGNTEGGVQTDKFEYRDSNVPLAFFSPMLTTDNKGNLSYKFTVPNANTTWILNALAYTDDLKTAQLSKTAIASKPIMVSPNLPRFVRTGDIIFIESQIFNTTDSSLNAITSIEIINPEYGNVIHSDTFTNFINTKESVKVGTHLSVPYDTPYLCFRIKTKAEDFSDGEQAFIPILPSSTPVFEATDFYVPANENKLRIQLPEFEDNAQVTLTYCDNPIWCVVTALPGLRQNNPISAVDAARNIFSAAIAQGIIKQYPQIGKALEYWVNNPSDSTLTSMLERNSDLKTMLLAATPWMQNAQSDSERMTRLALLLNNKECEKVIAQAIKFITSLQNTDGGICWMPRYNIPSLWATTTVLNTIGRLNTLGYMPENNELKQIINNGLKYIEKEYSSIYFKHPDSDFSTYAETVTLYPNFTPSTIGRSMISATIQRAIKNWKDMGISKKASVAQFLFRSGNKATASAILNSLDEYSTVTPDKGMWWQPLTERASAISALSATATALNAYAIISPGAPQIEKITQWLVLQKQATDWGNSSVASEVVAAILCASPEWISKSGNVRFKINGKTIPAKSTEYSGETKITLNPETASGAHLEISRNSSTPAWGGIVSVETKSMDNIKAVSCNQLSITKQFVIAGNNGWEKRDNLTVGDKVKITITIKSETAIDYLTITDSRAACFEPVEQTPTPVWSDGICFYRENRDSNTNIFVEHLPKGTFVIEYEMWVNNAGDFASGIATAQSQYSPEITAHSGGNRITVTTK